MSLSNQKSEIVVDRVSPLGGLFEIKGKLQIKKPAEDRPIFEIDPDTGTFSNDDVIIGHNDLDIPVFTLKDKNGFSIITDLTTETLSGKLDPSKGIKLQSNPTKLFGTQNNRITIGNINGSPIPLTKDGAFVGTPGRTFGLGSITINSEDLTNYKDLVSSIRMRASNTIIEDISGSAAFYTNPTFNPTVKEPFTNIIIGAPRSAKTQIYKGTEKKYGGSTPFLGSGSRTIVKNTLEVLDRTHIKGDLKVGLGSIDIFGTEGSHVYTHFNNFTSPMISSTVGVGGVIPVYASQAQIGSYYYSGYYLGDPNAASNVIQQPDGTFVETSPTPFIQQLFDDNIAIGGNGFDALPIWAVTDLEGAGQLVAQSATPDIPYIAAFLDTGDVTLVTTVTPAGPGVLGDSKGQLKILAGKESGTPNNWILSASLGFYGTTISASLADGTIGPLHQNPDNPNQSAFVSQNNVGRDNQPSIQSRGSLTILIDSVNDVNTVENRFFEIISGIDDVDEFNSQKSLLTITPSDERTAVKHLSSSGDLFASTSLSTNEQTSISHKIVVVDTASGKFFHKDVTSADSFLSLSDTPNEYIIPATSTFNAETGQTETTPELSFVSHSLVVGELGLQFIQAVHSASFAITASHALNSSGDGVGFPYAGSDTISTDDDSAAVITGSLFLSGSGNVTADGLITATTISASVFSSSTTNAVGFHGTASYALTASYISSSNIDGTITATDAISASYVSGVLIGDLTGTASHATSAVTASHALTASYISTSNIDGIIVANDATTAISGGSFTSPFHIVNDGFVGGDLTVSGTLGVGESITLADITFSASAEAFTFGSGSDNTITHQMTGNLALSASVGITANMSENVVGFIGTASHAQSSSIAITSSHAVTASYISSSNIDGIITATDAISASYASGVLIGDPVGTSSHAVTASFATTASHAITASYVAATDIDGQVGFPFIGDAEITGSLHVSSAIHVQTEFANVVGVFATASHAQSASSAINTISASYVSGVIIGDPVGTASHAITASYVAATDIDGQVGFPFTGSAAISGNLSVEGNSGNIIANNNISASSFSSSITNGVGFHGTASFANNAITASYISSSDIDGIIDATNAISASYASGVLIGDLTGTASHATVAESITDNTMLLTQLKDVPDTGDFTTLNGYPNSHEGFALVVSGNNSEMEFVQAVPSASTAISSSHALSASHAVTAAFAINTTPSPTAFTSLTDVFGTDEDGDGDGDTTAVSYANIAWGPGSQIIYTTAHTGSFTGSMIGTLTGDVTGTASHATSAVTASHALTASYVDVDSIEGTINATEAISASYVSGVIIGDPIGTSSHAESASNATNAISASYLSSFLDIGDVPDVYDTAQQHIVQVKNDLSGLEFVQAVQSASHAETASYVDATNIDGEIDATNAISASYVSGVIIGDPIGTSSHAESASNAINAISASYVSGILIGDLTGNVTGDLTGTASFADSASHAITASYVDVENIVGDITATNATTAISGGSATEPFHIVNDGFIGGDLEISGALGVGESITLADIVITASADAFIFGSGSDNTIVHQMTGNLELSASVGITANMSENVVGFIGTASHAQSASHALTASYINLDDIDGTLTGFPYAGSDDLAGDPAQAVITGSLFLSGSGNITSSNISASNIIATSLQINNAQKITGLDNADVAQDIAFITDGNTLTFGDIDLATEILGENITLDSANSITIDSDTGVVEFQDNGVTSITFNTTNGAITASNISASTFSSSLSSGVGFHGTASYALTSSLTISSSHAETASFFDGTIGNATNAISASYASGVLIGDPVGTSSHAQSASNATNAISASYVSGVLIGNLIGNVTGDLTGTASHATSAVTASHALTASLLVGSVENATSASHAESSSVSTNAISASYLEKFTDIGDTPADYTNATSHSVVVKSNGLGVEFVSIVQSASNAISASQAQNAVTASYVSADSIDGETTTFAALDDTNVTAGAFPNNQVVVALNNELIFTDVVDSASVAVSASHAETASHFAGTIDNVTNAISASYASGVLIGDLTGTASVAINAISASYVSGVIIGDPVGTSSHAVTASFATTAANVTGEITNAISASYVSGVMTGSLHGTASHALNAIPFPFEGFAAITGSLDLIGSITTQSNAIQNNLTDNTYVNTSVATTNNEVFQIFNNETGSFYPNTNSDVVVWFNVLNGIDLEITYDIGGNLGYNPVVDRLGLMFNVDYFNKRINISGSNDNNIYVPLGEERFPSTEHSRSFAFNNIDPYRFYRFEFPDSENSIEGSLLINEIFLYSDQGSVTANNFYGPLVGTASFAETASHAINSISASYISGVMTGSLFGSASYALTASFLEGEISNAISASYVSGVLIGDLTGTASHATSAVTASHALTASHVVGDVTAINSISASYVSGVMTGSLHGTASVAINAISASYVSGVMTGSLHGDVTGTASYATLASQSETIQVSLSNYEADNVILFSENYTNPSGEFVGVHADPSMSYNAHTDTFNVPNISATSITASAISASSYTSSLASGIGFLGTASFAITASHALNSSGDGVGFPYSGSDTISTEPHSAAVITGSLFLSGSGNITADGLVKATTISASVFSSSTAPGVGFFGTASYAVTASFVDGTIENAVNAISGGSAAEPFHIVNDGFIGGDLNVSGTLAVGESLTIADVTISQSGDAFTFGSGSANTIIHQMTGNLEISASTGITVNVDAGDVGFFGTASYASHSLSASHAVTASFFVGTIENATNAISASYVSGVMTGSLHGDLTGTASWAYSASQALTASHLLGNIAVADNASTASYVGPNGVIRTAEMTGSLQGPVDGTASHAVNSINAITASTVDVVSTEANSTDYFVTFVQGEEGSHIIETDDAFTYDPTLNSITVPLINSNINGTLSGTVVGDVTGSLLGTASHALTAVTASHLLGSVETSYLNLTDTQDDDFLNKEHFVPIVKGDGNLGTEQGLLLVQTVPSASFAVTASHVLKNSYLSLSDTDDSTYEDQKGLVPVVNSTENGLKFSNRVPTASVAINAITASHALTTATVAENADSAAGVDLQPALGRHRIALTDNEGLGLGEQIFSPDLEAVMYSTPARSFGLGITDSIMLGTSYIIDGIPNIQKGPIYQLELTNFARIHGDIDGTNRPYAVLRPNLGQANLNPIGKKYSDVGIVLSGRARSIYSTSNINSGNEQDRLDSDLVRLISLTEKNILSIGKSYQVNNGLSLHAGAGNLAGERGIKFYLEEGVSDESAQSEDALNGPVHTEMFRGFDSNDNQGSTRIKGKVSIGSLDNLFLTPNETQFIIHNPNNPTITNNVGNVTGIQSNEGHSFGIGVKGDLPYRVNFLLDSNAFRITERIKPTHKLPIVIETTKFRLQDFGSGLVEETSQMKQGIRLHMDNETGNIVLPADHGDTEDFDQGLNLSRFKSPFKLFIEGNFGLRGLSALLPQANYHGTNNLDTGKGLHVNNGITHLAASTIIGSPFRKATTAERLSKIQFDQGELNSPHGIFNGGPGSGDERNTLGAILVSRRGEPIGNVTQAYLTGTPNSSSIFNQTGNGIAVSSNDYIGGQVAFPLTSYGGEFQHNIDNAFNDAGFPFEPDERDRGTYNMSLAEDFKLLVNGHDFRDDQISGFTFDELNNPEINADGIEGDNKNAIRSIGVNQFQARHYVYNFTVPFQNGEDTMNPNTNGDLGETAMTVTGSAFFTGTANEFLTNNFNIGREPSATFEEVLTQVSINGSLFINNAAVEPSDRKLKQNIVNLGSQLDNIKSLQPREFEWKKDNKKGVGLIAQEVQEVYPSLINKKEETDTLYVNYTGMVPMLIKGMQEQQEIIEKLTSRINELEKKIDK